MSTTLKKIAGTLLAGALTLGGTVGAQEPMVVRVNTFSTASYVAVFMGVPKGIFAKYGLKVEHQITPNSQQQRDGLAKGAFEIAHAAVDNAVAMVELAKEDVIIVTGGDGSMNEFMVRPEIKSFADIHGKIVVVDAPNTAYALVAKKILKNAGLLEGRDYTVRPIGGTASRIVAMVESAENVAGMLNPPFNFEAKDRGLRSLGSQAELLGPYQAGGAFVMRNWARANGAVLERYLAAHVEATRWVMAPENRAEVIAFLGARFKQDPRVAAQTYDALMNPRAGLAPDAKFNMDGFKAVLALRAEMQGQWGGKAPEPERYFDLSYYERALKQVK